MQGAVLFALYDIRDVKRIDLGKVLDPTLDQVAEEYRAMDERRQGDAVTARYPSSKIHLAFTRASCYAGHTSE